VLVVGILAALAGLLLPALEGAVMVARVTQVRSDLRHIETAVHAYHCRYEAYPPARKYCLTGKRHLYLALPPELWEQGFLDTALEDPFNPGQTYRYEAVGLGYVNDSPAVMKFSIPANFPRSGGAVTKYASAETSPVKWIAWSVGARGLPPFEVLLGFNPVDPANWYPEDPRGIIVRYGTGKGCREAP
jgi:type II secretory pathway pseudopilin PulG